MVSPRQFVEAFDETVAVRQQELIGLWSDVKGYTAYVLRGAEPLLKQVATSLGQRYLGHEFLSTDATFLADDDSWRVPVVIEHENAVAGAGHEIYKLAHISVPLRVLITYPFKTGKDDKHLDKYRQILEEVGASVSGQLLVVFATISGTGESINWRYYLYAGSEFFPITPKGLVSV
jgi:hypothetical protein